MALEIVWTKRAINGFDRIVNYLAENWTEKEVQKFIHQSREFFNLLKEHPDMLEKTRNRKYVHRGPLNKHTILTYRIKPRNQQIELLNIREAKRKPLKK